MKYGIDSPVTLCADRHYESLRDAVWLRVVSEDPRMPWAAFEDAYQEAWAWIAARERDGRPVVADSGSPVAYLAQTVRRRYVDQLRAERRGLGRDAAAPVLEPLEAADGDVAGGSTDEYDAASEARRVVSAVYLLARERLSARELQAFALTYMLEMKPAEGAKAMGVSAKRFRNLRWDGWRKVGDEVVALLEGRLQWCSSDEATELRARALSGDPDARGPLRVHLASCAACSHRVAEARRAAAAVLPLPFVLCDHGGFVERLAALRDELLAAVARPAESVGRWAAVMPASGRAVAVTALVGGAVVGGASEPGARGEIGGESASRSAPAAPVARDATVRHVVVRAPRSVEEPKVQRRRRGRGPVRAAAARPSVVAAPAPAAIARRTPPPPAPEPALPVPAPRAHDSGEFGFE